jgi:hypothetical protein
VPSKRRTWLLVAVIVVVAVVVVAGLYLALSLPRPAASKTQPANGASINQLGSSRRTANVTPSWGLAAPFPCSTVCEVINFTVSATAGFNTSTVGLGIANSSGKPSSVPWVAFLWNASRNASLAGYSNVSGAWGWVAAAGSALPVTDLQGDQLMIVSATYISGQGYIIAIFGTGPESGNGYQCEIA